MASVAPLLGVMEADPNAYTYDRLISTNLVTEPSLLFRYIQDAGGFAGLGLLLWFIYVFLTPSPAIAGGRRKLISAFQAVTGLGALIGYIVALGLILITKFGGVEQTDRLLKSQTLALTVAGALALLAFCEPFFLDLFRMKWRRVYAMAKLSFKEAVRKRIPLVFLLFLVVILFPTQWFTYRMTKAEDVLKAQIAAMTIWMAVLAILTALLLSGFSIPTDVKNLTIHTIVTKPVERFEIVVGRSLGYIALETLALIGFCTISVLSVFTSGITDEAREETMRARVPVYGTLQLVSERSSEFKGIDVGREHNVRKYIAGGQGTPHRAMWYFSDVGDLKNFTTMPKVPMEFAFDIYRTTKGEENRGVECTFDFWTWKWDPSREQEYRKAIVDTFHRSSQINITPDSEDWAKIDKIAETFGRFELTGKSIYDYHTQIIHVPPGLFRNALDGAPATAPGSTPNRVRVSLRCDSPSQFVGVAQLDLYFLESDGRSRVEFTMNFFKGALGLWCRVAIVIVLAVAASTYLAGVVSFLAAAFLFLAGYFQDFIKSLADGTNIGGGPFESFTRLIKGTTGAGELDKTPTVQAALFGDDMFRWVLRRILNVIPDTERFTWSKYLEQGFSISPEFIGMHLLVLAAYSLPWLVLAYYLMRSREIAA